MSTFTQVPQFDLGNGWWGDLTTGMAGTNITDEYGTPQRRQLTPDEIAGLQKEWANGAGGRATAASQHAADTDWGGFGNLVRGLSLAGVGGLMGGGALGLLGDSAGGWATAANGLDAPVFSGGGNTLAGALGGDASWGVNPQGGSMSVGSYNPADPFNFAADNTTSVGTNIGSGGGVENFLPGGQYSQYGAGGGMVDLGGAGGVAGVQAALESQSPGLWQKLLQQVGNNPLQAAQIAGRLLATGVGVLGANQQTKALQGLSNQFAEYGAPYRARLAASYADPAGFLKNSPDINAAVQQGTDATARALSVQGNPAQSGHALQELQNYATTGLYGKLGQERDRLAGFGGLTAYNAAAPSAATNAVTSQAGPYNAIGAGINTITNPPKTAYQTMQEFFNMPGVA